MHQDRTQALQLAGGAHLDQLAEVMKLRKRARRVPGRQHPETDEAYRMALLRDLNKTYGKMARPIKQEQPKPWHVYSISTGDLLGAYASRGEAVKCVRQYYNEYACAAAQYGKKLDRVPLATISYLGV
jgi:hypothetical protein